MKSLVGPRFENIDTTTQKVMAHGKFYFAWGPLFWKFLSLLPEKTDTLTSGVNESQMTISLKSVAERNIVKIKEELFFNGKLE